jgi:hypothetical protein
MPRRRPDPAERRAAQLRQEQADRRLQEQVLAGEAEARRSAELEEAARVLAAAAAEREEPPFDPAAWQRNSRITALMRTRFGTSWASSPRLQRLAQRALADLNGNGDGKAIARLRSYRTDTYLQALEMKYGPEQ